MRTKDLEKLIKSESQKIEIPNVSVNIQEKLNNYRRPEVVYSEKAHQYKLGFVFKLSMSFLLVLFVSITIFRVNTADPITDDSIVEAVVLSTVISSQVAIDSLSVEDEITLLAASNGQQTTDTTALETEVNHLTSYLGVIENMMSNAQNYRIQKKRLNALSRQYQLTFSTTDLEDESTSYTVQYKEISKNENTYEINGEITQDGNVYQLEISYDKETKTMTTKTYQYASDYVEVSYAKNGSTYTYQISKYADDTLEESVEISFQGMQQISLAFVNSEASGTYTFQVATTTMNRRFLQVDYDVEGHVGQMQIAISLTNRSQYVIAVTPEGQDTVTFTRSRRNTMN